MCTVTLKTILSLFSQSEGRAEEKDIGKISYTWAVPRVVASTMQMCLYSSTFENPQEPCEKWRTLWPLGQIRFQIPFLALSASGRPEWLLSLLLDLAGSSCGRTSLDKHIQTDINAPVSMNGRSQVAAWTAATQGTTICMISDQEPTNICIFIIYIYIYVRKKFSVSRQQWKKKCQQTQGRHTKTQILF